MEVVLLLLALMQVVLSTALAMHVFWPRPSTSQSTESVPIPVQAARATPLLIEPEPLMLVLPSEDKSDWTLIRPRPAPVLVEPTGPSLLVEPALELFVEPPQRGYWDDKAWVKRDGADEYHGYYQVREQQTAQARAFRGIVRVERGIAQSYILEKPPEMARHPKNRCFFPFTPESGWEQGNWSKVNWHVPPENVDEAIMKVETYLAEALNRR